jgi:hypothetical protein
MTSWSEDRGAPRFLITPFEAVRLTACRITVRILKREPSQRQLSRLKPLRDASIAERLLLNIANLICGRSAKLPEKRSSTFRAFMSLEINRAALFGCWLHFRYGTLIRTPLVPQFATRLLTTIVSRATILVAG